MRVLLCMAVTHHTPETLAAPTCLDPSREVVEVESLPRTRREGHCNVCKVTFRARPLAHEKFPAIGEHAGTDHELATADFQQAVRVPARAGNRRFCCLSALRAHTKTPYKMDFHRETLMALNRPGAARTDVERQATAAVLPGARLDNSEHKCPLPPWRRPGQLYVRSTVRAGIDLSTTRWL